MSKLVRQCQPHLEPIQDKTEEIELSRDTSEGGEDDWSNKYDVAETQQTQSPGGPQVSAVQLSPGLGNTENYKIVPPIMLPSVPTRPEVSSNKPFHSTFQICPIMSNFSKYT